MLLKPAYAPFWCEENMWHLAADARVGAGARAVVLVTGATGHVACWQQRAAPAVGVPVVWDYHVVLAVASPGGWQVWDLDCLVGCPLPADLWLRATFPDPHQVRAEYQPRFLAMSATAWREDLHSTRDHMRTADGQWRQPLPPWPRILGNGPGLQAWLQAARSGLTLAQLQMHWCQKPG